MPHGEPPAGQEHANRERSGYRGRLAPSPTGYLHLGHARTFWIAQERARLRKGVLILRNEDLDGARCRPEYVSAMLEDLRWFGLRWDEGPDCGGTLGPYVQSQRLEHYAAAFARLRQSGLVYPCRCSRRDIQQALAAPHLETEEPVYPGTCRPAQAGLAPSTAEAGAHVSWRFRVPDGESITFLDARAGAQSFVSGKDFGDFVVWRHDPAFALSYGAAGGWPAYQLAVVVDDAAMAITEVVRGSDLLVSTARQLLLYRALGWRPPDFYHCPLLTDERGVRLAKRHDALSLRTLRAQGAIAETLRGGSDIANGE